MRPTCTKLKKLLKGSRADAAHTPPLLGVLTVSEAATAYGVSERTIRYHVDMANVTYRKAGHLLLIDKASLERLHQRIYALPLKTKEIYIQTEKKRNYGLQDTFSN